MSVENVRVVCGFLVVIAVILFLFGGCTRVDDLTGTTIQERCAYRQAAIAAFELRLTNGEELSDGEMDVYHAYRSYVNVVCAQSPAM